MQLRKEGKGWGTIAKMLFNSGFQSRTLKQVKRLYIAEAAMAARRGPPRGVGPCKL
jgi:hypothetical protein